MQTLGFLARLTRTRRHNWATLAFVSIFHALPVSAKEPCRLTLLGQYPVSGSWLVVDGPTLVVGSIYGGVKLIDVSDLNAITLKSNIVAKGPIDAADGLLAVAEYSNGIVRMFDIHDPSAPVELASYVVKSPPGPTMAAIHAGHVYAMTNTAVEIVKIDPPSLPKLVSTYTPTSGLFAIAARDGILISSSTSKSEIVSISDPANPALMSTFTHGFCNAGSVPAIRAPIAAVGSYSSYCGTPAAYDISSPANPIFMSGLLSGTAFTTHFAIAKGLIAVPSSYQVPKITLVDPSTYPWATVLAEITTKPGHRVASDGEHLFTLQGSDGLRVYSVDPCYANCDCNASALDIDDFICFQSRFALADPYADCDADGSLTVDDFVCFQAAYAMGC